MFKDFIHQQEGVQWYAIISLLIFVLFFVGVSVYAFFYTKSYIEEVSALPLGDDSISSSANDKQTV